MRVLRVALAFSLTFALGTPTVSAGDATGAFAPYEDLLQVVADLTWHLRDDVYRFPPPKDPTGHDLYRLSLHRLENWSQRYPSRLREITRFGRALALERLGEYAAATALYEDVATSASPLRDEARVAVVRAAAFAAAAALPEDAPDLERRLTALRAKLDAWQALVSRFAGTTHQSLALVEEERIERSAAELVVMHRHGLEDGTATAERALRFLIRKHADSKNLPAHILRLGDLYAALTREYVAAHERPLSFREDEFLGHADRALDTYRKVATWDGALEKPEGQARFATMDTYRTRVLTRYR